MERKPVTSTNVKSIGYDPATKTLEVEYKSGGVYQHVGVPVEHYQELRRAKSIGSYLHTEIKPRFECTKIEESDGAE